MKFSTLSNTMSSPDYQISDMVWNQGGNVLAVSYFIDDHVGPCSHSGYISFFKFDSLTEATTKVSHKTYSSKIEVETNACVQCIDSHPKISNIFVAGSYIGEIYYINLGNENDQIECISKIDSLFYKECVISVKFVKYDESAYYIVSISSEGRILVWNPSDRLKYPVMGFNLKFNLGRTTLAINPTCFVNSPQEAFEFLLGTYDGNLYKCKFNKPTEDSGNHQEYIFLQKKGVVWRQSVRTLISNMKEKELTEMKNLIEKICLDKEIINLDLEEFFKLRPDVSKIYKNALKSHFEKHLSCVSSISYNQYIKQLFATTSYDGSMRLYYGDAPGSKFFYSQYISKNSEGKMPYYTVCSWSPYKPSLFVTGTSLGEISFNCLTGVNTAKNVLTIQSNNVGIGIKKIQFNPSDNKNVIAIAYDDATVEILGLSEGFSRVGNSEIEKLYKIVKNI